MILNQSRVTLITLVLLLVLSSLIYGQNKRKPLSTIDLATDSIFVNYLANFKKYVKTNDSVKLEKLLNINYGSANIHILNKKLGLKDQLFKLKGKAHFMKMYSRLFDKRMKTLILNSSVKDCLITQMGIKFNRGQLWWDYDLSTKVISTRAISNTDYIFVTIREN